MIWRQTLVSVIIGAGLFAVVEWFHFGWESHGHRLDIFFGLLALYVPISFASHLVAKLSALEKELSDLRKEVLELKRLPKTRRDPAEVLTSVS